MCLERSAIFELGLQVGISNLSAGDALQYLQTTYDQVVPRRAIVKLVAMLRDRGDASHRRKDRFVARNRAWLKSTLCLSQPICNRTRGGRPRVPFSEMSRSSKLRATNELRRQSSRELVFAAASATYKEGRCSAGRLV